MSFSDVEGALLSAAKTVLNANGFPDSKIQSENVAFEPTGQAAWASLFFIPSQPDVLGLGNGGLDRVIGLFQIDLYYPQNTGTSQARAMVDILRAEFIAGKYYTKNDAVVEIVSCGPSPGSNVDSWYKRIITIEFRSNITRTVIT